MEKIPADEETMQEMREKHPGEDLSMLLKSRDNELEFSRQKDF